MAKNKEFMKEHYSFDELQKIIACLRAPDGCLWDRALTHESMETCVLEESAEVIQAVRNGDMDNLCEELGDLLLQVLLHCAIAQEAGEFTFEEVVDGLSAKLVRRHPNVFYEDDHPQEDLSASEGLKRWEAVKAKEKEGTGWTPAYELERIPQALPAVYRTQKVLKKAEKLFGADNIDRKAVEELGLLVKKCEESQKSLTNRLETFIKDMKEKQ
jgi:tetrapyrrole methylase family protein/MazG family protein